MPSASSRMISQRCPTLSILRMPEGLLCLTAVSILHWICNTSGLLSCPRTRYVACNTSAFQAEKVTSTGKRMVGIVASSKTLMRGACKRPVIALQLSYICLTVVLQ